MVVVDGATVVAGGLVVDKAMVVVVDGAMVVVVDGATVVVVVVVGATVVVVVGGTVVVVGGVGTATTAAEKVLVPPAFVPATVKVYETPLASPVTR